MRSMFSLSESPHGVRASQVAGPSTLVLLIAASSVLGLADGMISGVYVSALLRLQKDGTEEQGISMADATS